MIGQVQTFIAASIHNYYYNSVVFLGIRSHRRQQLAVCVCVCEMKSQPGENAEGNAAHHQLVNVLGRACAIIVVYIESG